MSEALEYFRKVYDTVPGWVQKMHDYSPEVLDTYTGIRGEIMQDGALSRKEKDVLIAGMNAARLYARSMVYHTKGAVDFGSSVPEIVEYFLTAYVYKGVPALQTAVEAVRYALELNGNTVPEAEGKDAEEILREIIGWLDGEDTTYLEDVLSLVESGDQNAVERKILDSGLVPDRLKLLNMVGNHIVELDGKGAVQWMERARQAGATEAELADVGYICILTAGIPAWFELSDSLKAAAETKSEG
ncbi:MULTISPECIES: carboxymuconolactone decarboxylase family protein [Bhargavaea]|uniref:Carboxymuconolactone decarboxylase family protein n=1 Tax=Bhargavaea changchunensis TaxID=2134037 RepID=A0ABW2NDI4_9BACL|nr:carboxymuconolactone decarboxylase family protein [Bhargavaea sp. CC-171006]